MFSEAGYKQSKAKYSLFILSERRGFVVLVCVDGIIVAGNDLVNKWSLNDHFKLKELEYLKHFLEIKVARSKVGIHLLQRKCALKILDGRRFLSAKASKFPTGQNLKLDESNDKLLTNPCPYCKIVGRLMYLSITNNIMNPS